MAMRRRALNSPSYFQTVHRSLFGRVRSPARKRRSDACTRSCAGPATLEQTAKSDGRQGRLGRALYNLTVHWQEVCYWESESSRIFSRREGFDLSVDPSGRLHSRSADAQSRVQSVDNRQHLSLWYFVVAVLFMLPGAKLMSASNQASIRREDLSS
jgi:hypothetical protein